MVPLCTILETEKAKKTNEALPTFIGFITVKKIIPGICIIVLFYVNALVLFIFLLPFYFYSPHNCEIYVCQIWPYVSQYGHNHKKDSKF